MRLFDELRRWDLCWMVAINSTGSVYFISPMNETEEQAFERLLELVRIATGGCHLASTIESKPDNDPNAPGRITPLRDA